MLKYGLNVGLFFVVLCVSAAFTGYRSDINARVRLTVISELPFANVPMDPKIDFSKLIKDAGLSGVLDPNSIEVFDVADGKPVPYVRTEDFVYGDKGRIQWVIRVQSWGRTIDFDNDGAMDILIGFYDSIIYLRNTTPTGQPLQFKEEATIATGTQACFFDIDSDGLLDSVCLEPRKNAPGLSNYVANISQTGKSRQASIL